jgi:hypothetical protein
MTRELGPNAVALSLFTNQFDEFDEFHVKIYHVLTHVQGNAKA